MRCEVRVQQHLPCPVGACTPGRRGAAAAACVAAEAKVAQQLLREPVQLDGRPVGAAGRGCSRARTTTRHMVTQGWRTLLLAAGSRAIGKGACPPSESAIARRPAHRSWLNWHLCDCARDCLITALLPASLAARTHDSLPTSILAISFPVPAGCVCRPA